ncbi:MAG: hypothetical protein JHC93_05695 [Parachlamydiales bacterium]|nr:hypothetical protein [Parachlamydiales bacterium]
MSKIPPKRLLAYLIMLGILPLILLIYSQNQRHQKMKRLENGLQSAQDEMIKAAQRQSKNIEIAKTYQGRDQHYLEKNVESLQFLENEARCLKEWIETASFLDVSLLQDRLSFINNNKNKLCFRETQAEQLTKFNETLQVLQNPVEVNSYDIINILEHLEFGENTPHFLITDFKLERKNEKLQQEVFSLDLKLIRREYL